MTCSTLPLSYCTNVHPGRTVEEVVAGLTDHTAPARGLVDRPVAAGLWFSAGVIRELMQSDEALEQLAQTLWQHDLVCYTLNTFPFGDFHSDRVKEQVYLPDWSDPDRLAYTRDCAAILARLLPPGGEGSLSTVPLGGTMNPSGPEFIDDCLAQLLDLSGTLKELHDSTGRRIRLGLEPEPHCHLSSVERQVLPVFERLFARAAEAGREAEVREHIGLCFDVCHQAVEFEDVAQSIDRVRAAGIRINKVHITNAVELERPAENPEGREALQAFVEPRYLHQTFARMPDNSVRSRLDLLRDDITREPADAFLRADAWRVHFHVPVDRDRLGPLKTTQPDLRRALRAVARLDYAPHLEVETYTWPVMPGVSDAGEAPLAERIASELAAASDLIAEATAAP